MLLNPQGRPGAFYSSLSSGAAYFCHSYITDVLLTASKDCDCPVYPPFLYLQSGTLSLSSPSSSCFHQSLLPSLSFPKSIWKPPHYYFLDFKPAKLDSEKHALDPLNLFAIYSCLLPILCSFQTSLFSVSGFSFEPIISPERLPVPSG